MLLLDSDVVIDITRQHAGAVSWMNRVRQQFPAVPGYVALEVLNGCRNARELRAAQAMLSGWSIIWPDPASCDAAFKTFADIHLSNAIGVIDILVAQTAISRNLPLHTFNVKHYAAVPGLQTIQPYTR